MKSEYMKWLEEFERRYGQVPNLRDAFRGGFNNLREKLKLAVTGLTEAIDEDHSIPKSRECFRLYDIRTAYQSVIHDMNDHANMLRTWAEKGKPKQFVRIKYFGHADELVEIPLGEKDLLGWAMEHRRFGIHAKSVHNENTGKVLYERGQVFHIYYCSGRAEFVNVPKNMVTPARFAVRNRRHQREIVRRVYDEDSCLRLQRFKVTRGDIVDWFLVGSRNEAEDAMNKQHGSLKQKIEEV